MVDWDWVDYYLDNEGFERSNHAFGFTSNFHEGREPNTVSKSLADVIRRCSKAEKELSPGNFKKLKITVVDEYCFNTVERLESKQDSKYEYLILLPDYSLKESEDLVKHKMAHELAHFLFSLQKRKFNNQNDEEKECNRKAKEWGFLN